MDLALNYWQFNCKKLDQRIGYLIQTGQWSDCKFLVGLDSTRVVIDAHRMILATASPVFEAMFYGEMAESKDPILIPDIQPSTFKIMLRYIYTDHMKITSFDEAFNLYCAANKYILPDLENECTKYIDANLNIKYAGRTYEFVSHYNETNLMEKCLQLFSTNTKEILNDSSLEDLQLSTLIRIFSSEKINCTELDLFKAAERYVKVLEKHVESDMNTRNNGLELSKDIVVVNMETEKGTQTDAETESSKQESPSSPAQETNKAVVNTTTVTAVPESRKMSYIRPAIEKIRFLTLTPEEFATGPAKSGLLTEAEVSAILLNIASSCTTNVKMPNEFSISRQKREPVVQVQVVKTNQSYCNYCRRHY